MAELASQQEIFYSGHSVYGASLADLAFVASQGVLVTLHASADGWAARVTHAALVDSERCAMYYGSAMPGIDALEDVEPGELFCTS